MSIDLVRKERGRDFNYSHVYNIGTIHFTDARNHKFAHELISLTTSYGIKIREVCEETKATHWTYALFRDGIRELTDSLIDLVYLIESIEDVGRDEFLKKTKGYSEWGAVYFATIAPDTVMDEYHYHQRVVLHFLLDILPKLDTTTSDVYITKTKARTSGTKGRFEHIFLINRDMSPETKECLSPVLDEYMEKVHDLINKTW